MPRYDLIASDEPTFEVDLTGTKAFQKQRKRRWPWIISTIVLAALLGVAGFLNLVLIQSYVDAPALISTMVTNGFGEQDPAVVAPAIADQRIGTDIQSAEIATSGTASTLQGVSDSAQEGVESAKSAIEESTREDSASEGFAESNKSTLNNLGGKRVDNFVVAEPKENSELTFMDISSDNPVGYSGLLLQSVAGSLTVVGPSGASVLDIPAGDLLTILSPGTPVAASGRSANNRWLLVTSDDGTTGWVTADSLMLSLGDVNLDTLSVESNSAADQTTALTAQNGPSPDMVARQPTIEPLPSLQPSPTASSTPIPISTDTPTDAPTAVATVDISINSSTLNAAPTVFAVVRSQGATLRRVPNGEVLRSLRSGFTLDAVGRGEDGAWLRVVTNDNEVGWIGADRVVAFRVSTLPVVGVDGKLIVSAPALSDESVRAPQATDLRPTTVPQPPVPQPPVPQPTTLFLPTVTPLPTPTSRPAPINSEELPIAKIVIDDARLNIRSGPDSSYLIIGKAFSGESFVVLGRSEDNEWIQIEVFDVAGEFGWIAAEFANLSESIDGIPPSSQVNFDAPLHSDRPNSASMTTPTESAKQPTVTPNPRIRPSRSSQGSTSSSGLAAINSPEQAIKSLSTLPSAKLSGKIVFQESPGGNIYVYNFTDSSLRTLSNGLDPAISLDGSKVVFGRFGQDGGIYTIDINGANEQRIYVDTTVRSPKWSPDGKWIVFSRLTGEYACRDISFSTCLQNNPSLSLVTRDNNEERTLTRIDPSGDSFRDLAVANTAYTPDWNEDGIVYQAATSIEITEDKPNGDTQAVWEQAIGYQDPDWQPTGGRIVFQGKQGSHWEIFSIQPDGGGLKALTRPVTALVDELPSNVSPVWSPDGRHIVYISNRDADENAGAWRLWVMNADGSEKRVLPIDVSLDYAFNKEQMVSWGQ